MGKRMRGDKGRGNEEAGETAGEGGGRSCPLLPFFHPRSQRGGVKLTRLLVRARLSPPNGGGGFFHGSIDNGAARYPPAAPFRACLLVSTMGGT
jgi:hypothetical protein